MYYLRVALVGSGQTRGDEKGQKGTTAHVKYNFQRSTIVGFIAPLERLLDDMLEGFGMVNEPLL